MSVSCEYAGQTVKCPTCGRVVAIPEMPRHYADGSRAASKLYQERTGEPHLNKIAYIAFGLSLLSFFGIFNWFPFVPFRGGFVIKAIMAGVGIVLGIIGMRSEKKGLAFSSIIISFLSIAYVLVVYFMIYSRYY